MTTADSEAARDKGYQEGRLYEQSKMRGGPAGYSRMAGRLDEQSKTLPELNAGQQRMIEMIDRANARTNERIDRLNERVDRIMLAGWIAGGVAIVTAQMGMLGTLIVLTIRLGSGS